jgi:hypothetical protein
VTRRFNVGQPPCIQPTFEGAVISGLPVRFYSRKVRGVGVCGLWVGGEPVYNVTVYDADERPLGMIDAHSAATQEIYDELRRVLVAEAIHA